jgi:serine/threonine protein phosphatase PrpC
VVIDGATPLGDSLMPGPSDAAWIAQFGARRLLAHLRDGDGARKALRAALADTQKSFEALRRHEPEEMWQTPCASMMLAAENEKGVEFLWYGDCAALLKQGDSPVTVIGETFDKRAAEAARAQTIAREKKLSPAAGLNRPEFLGTLRATRNRINSGSYWLFSPDVKAAAHVSRRVIKAAPGSTLLLATDGFLALASDYGAYSADSLMTAAQDKGLAALGEELRAIEAGDSGGDKFPRFKKSDDATALLLRLA